MATKTHPTMAIDLDGVICDHVSPLLPRVSTAIGRELEKKDLTSWDFPVAKTSLCREIEKSLEDRKFALTFPMIEGALEALEQISKSVKIIIVSSRNPKHREMTEEWLSMHGVHYPLLMTGRKDGVEADVLVDDNLEFAASFARSGRLAFLFSQPWNSDRSRIRALVESGSIVVCEGWHSVVESIRRFAIRRPCGLSEDMKTRVTVTS